MKKSRKELPSKHPLGVLHCPVPASGMGQCGAGKEWPGRMGASGIMLTAWH